MILLPVTMRDATFLYALLKQRPAVANISHRRMPGMKAHLAFIASQPYFAWYVIIADQGRRCGAVYLSDRNEIGVHVLAAERGKSWGRRAVIEIMRLHPRKRYLANIARGNPGLQDVFTGMGFTHIQNTYELRP